MIKKLAITCCIVTLSAVTTSAASLLSLSSQFTDSTIIMPESVDTDVHKMMENWYLRNYIDMDRNADSSIDNEVSDEILIKRLAAIPTTIEMPFHPEVKAYIIMYTQRRRQLVESMLGMSLYYMPIFEQALEREGVPLELKYLPIIESAMNPDAVSRVGATGLWQFMLPTARGLGMEINTLVDERRDPYKSSELAAKYLKQLYDIYHDWSLAIAAYNCGPGNVNKALKRAGDGDGKKRDFWAIYNYLPKETRGYVPCFIAANYVMNYYPEHNISPALARRPLITDSVHVTQRIHLQQIADVLQIPVEEIRVLNPQYREDYIPGDIRPYSLVLPSKQIYSFLLSEDSIANHNKELYARRLVIDPNSGNIESVRDDGDYIITEKVLWHKVKRGETLNSIGRRYGVTVSSLRSANGGISKVKKGQTIKIVTTQRTRKPKEDTIETANEEVVMVVGTGDTTVIMEENIVVAETGSDETAQVTTVAVVEEKPLPAPESPVKKATQTANSNKKQSKSAGGSTVTVRKGDTLSSIARRNNTTIAKLKKLNGLKNDKIQIGQKLKVK